MSNTPLTQYGPETPWLCWAKWPRAQHYQKANPAWIALYRSLIDDAEYNWVWREEGHAQLGVIVHLMSTIAKHGTSGIMYGAPELLAAELGLAGPPDLSKLVQAGWIQYISSDDKRKIEAELAAPKPPRAKPPADSPAGPPAPPTDREQQARQILAAEPHLTRAALAARLSCSVTTVERLDAWRNRRLSANNEARHRHQETETGTETGTERGTERGTGTGTEPSSGAPARKNSVAAIAAPPETGQPEAQREGQAEPEAQDGPEGPPQPAAPLSLVSDLPQPIPAALGLPGAGMPPQSDALGVGRAKARNPPPASSRSRASAQLLGSCLGPLAMAESCPDVWDWVESVYRLLRFPWPINSAEGRRETGSFAAMYNRVMAASLPMGERTKILVSSLKTAEQKGRKPVGYCKKGKGAVFCEVLNRRLKTHLARDG